VDLSPTARRCAARLSIAAAFAGGGFVLLGPPLVAGAEVSGPGCSAHITNRDGTAVDVAGVNSQDSSTAIPVTIDQVVRVDITGETGSPPTVHVDYGLTDRIGVGRDASGTSYSARVADYASVAGLYQVRVSTGPNGTCSAAALVDVGGQPLSTPFGVAALAASVVGLGGLAAGSAAAMGGEPGAPGSELGEDIPDRDPATGLGWNSEQLAHIGELDQKDPADAVLWIHATPAERNSIDAANSVFGKPLLLGMVGCLLPALIALAALPVVLLLRGTLALRPGPDGATATSAPVAPLRLPRRAWRPLFSASAMAGGLLGAIGVVALLQQYGKLFPTTGLLVRALVAGLLTGIALPSLGRVVRVRRANRRIAAIEARANQARERRSARSAATYTVSGGTAAYLPTHVVPAGGLDAWDAPDPARAPVDRLDPALDVQVTERSGDWAHVLCSNGWSAWVDGRGLQELSR